jgi:hypothetical protein
MATKYRYRGDETDPPEMPEYEEQEPDQEYDDQHEWTDPMAGVRDGKNDP